MNAFHVYWTPSEEKRNFKDYFVLTLILSALQWKKTNHGCLTFYGDPATLDYFEYYQLAELWDRCEDPTVDVKDEMKHYDLSSFFTIGKFLGLQKEACPCAQIDVDLVIWRDL